MGTSRKIKIGILTSSRADFGIYLPLLNQLKKESSTFEISIIAFGTHLSPFNGQTINEIYNNGFEVAHQISSILLCDDEESIATSYALTAMKFANFWSCQKNNFDCVLCLGDRFEMAAAVVAGLPFNIYFAHIHGGETTLGAIDNVFRHIISLASNLHFVSAEPFEKRIRSIVGNDTNCYLVGSLSLDGIEELKLPNKAEFKAKWNIDPDEPFILITIHPETIATSKTTNHVEVMEEVINELVLESNLVISMPNLDTHSSHFRESFEKLQKKFPRKVFLIENFGKLNYFAAMKFSSLVLGNSSSGIIEAASFDKYVINIGDRQKGRLVSDNVVHVPFNASDIIENTKKLKGKYFTGNNVYKINNAATSISDVLKKITIIEAY
jgi:GDP/UDP-N,N'-diacetylbacillosamine 2-epimerase (hydrolysing)